MHDENCSKPKLKLIQGGRRREIRLEGIQIVASAKEEPPFPVEAAVFEEDTYLVLSAAPVFRDIPVHPLRVMTEAIEARPAVLGSVIVKGSGPFRFLAIVHDLDQEPTWKEEWVANALESVFIEAEQRNLKSLSLPLVGTLHGSMDYVRFLQLMRSTLEHLTLTSLRRLWLVVPDESVRKVLDVLDPGEDQ